MNDTAKTLTIKTDGKGKIHSHIRKTWHHETPEERVRQEYVCVLVNEYGFSLDQMDEEIAVTERGSAQARADILIWRTAQDKQNKATPLIVVECKADNVAIDARTYTQGANYAQYCKARFFVTHNNRETKYWKVDHSRMMPNYDEIENIPHADASDKQIEELVTRLKVFKEDEFADLLHKCHNVIRNREAHDPTKAFDETAKILFVKVWVERELKAKRQRKNLFTVEFLESQLGDDPLNDLFEKTKKHYEKDAIFARDDKINLKPETGKEIVRLLQAYNLSDTSEDIKGIAFERFLGRTFRGEIGQFFTPRPIVEFMIQMLEPKEGETICDPASGSGGFLIRFFEIVRQQILADADRQYRAFAEKLAQDKSLDDDERARRLTKKYDEIQRTLDQKKEGSRLWTLANRRIYGTDKNDRMARTSKMNMIMHGDGHGGVHHWNGFLNVNGIFEGRFDLILTNPPFGAKVEADEKILEKEIELPEEVEEHYADIYGAPYRQARESLKAAVGKPIASLFKLPKSEGSKIKTEILFIERCLDLLKPGGRMGIVLPEGVFNNPSLAHVREFVEDRAFLRAVVSLPQETFFSSGASVKASLLFLQKFSEEEQAAFTRLQRQALAETKWRRRIPMRDERKRLKAAVAAAKKAKDADARKAAQKELADFEKRMESKITAEARALLKSRFDYPVFLYEAEKVGITATGEADENELVPGGRLPTGVERSALELYRAFRQDPTPFFV
ncbi:MAG: N-6 DNA methylase [Sulfuricellaceae bacterium]|jgi:type I restriction enzyme M protein